MEDFNTVQDLIKWNSELSQTEGTPKRIRPTTIQAEEIARELVARKDPALVLETAKYLIGSLVAYHKKAVDVKRETGAPDVYIWAYDYAQLNSALNILHDVESEVD